MLSCQVNKCLKCGKDFNINETEIKWDETGYGYSTKLAICPHCDQLNVIGIVQDYGLDVNQDSRFYIYKPKNKYKK